MGDCIYTKASPLTIEKPCFAHVLNRFNGDLFTDLECFCVSQRLRQLNFFSVVPDCLWQNKNGGGDSKSSNWPWIVLGSQSDNFNVIGRPIGKITSSLLSGRLKVLSLK